LALAGAGSRLRIADELTGLLRDPHALVAAAQEHVARRALARVDLTGLLTAAVGADRRALLQLAPLPRVVALEAGHAVAAAALVAGDALPRAGAVPTYARAVVRRAPLSCSLARLPRLPGQYD